MAPPQHNPEDRPVAALLAPDIVALLDESPADIAVETEEIHPADLADVAEVLERDQLHAFLNALGPARAADVLEYLDEELRTEFLEAITPRQAAQLVTEMTPDDRADTLEEIDEEHAEDILSEFPSEARRETEKLLAYEPDTAGGLMTTEFVSVSADMTVEAALENVRAVARSGKKEAMHAIYTTDSTGRVVGVMSLRELLAAPSGAKISEIAWTEVVSVSPSADREEVARVIANYDLVAVPVVSESGHIMGVITVDDVIDAIQEEQTEDVQKLGGMEALDEPYSTISFWRMIKKRAGWLSALFLGEMLTATALGAYQKEIDKETVLALFLPLIISSGGNSGSQGTSLLIRALALREVNVGDWWRVASKEIATGLTLGIILAVIGFARIELWQAMADHHLTIFSLHLGHNYDVVTVNGVETVRAGLHNPLAVTVALSLVGVVLFGTLVGSMLPFVFRSLGFDPASASAPFIATFVDVTGLIIYFNVALHILLR
ncbi:MAG TPA: magnesium transporter [Gemmatimonadaceae bacterium]|jgi:magnesium transporter|nr:magnesium transporter [Gemmatimonadaceae bacterium]